MEIQLTKEQSDAVFAPVGDNLVSAAAGSGKTKVLSERIVGRLKSGDTSIDRLLIVTFTRAAAAQMRERILTALEKEYKNTSDAKIKRQISMVACADICTIDSFCIDLVRKNFFRVDISPDFTIADDNSMAILKEEVVMDVLDEMYEKADEDFIELAQSVGTGKNDNALKEMILRVYSFSRAFEEPDNWLEDACRKHKKGTRENDSLFEAIYREVIEQLKELREMLKKAQQIATKMGIDVYADVFRDEATVLGRDFFKEGSIEDGFMSFAFYSFSGKKVDVALKKEKEYLQDLHNEAKAFYGKIKELYEVYKSERGFSYKKITALVECVRLFEKKYMEEKRQRKELEFSDCEYLALKALRTSDEAVNELRDKYDEIYIDEYQDTNPLQDALFTLISRKERGEANMFIVGDIKQSIYRFRHSDPMLFMNKAEEFEKNENGKKMLLTMNFRSRREVLDSVNCVFERIMRKNTAEVEYDEEHALKCGAKFIEYNQNKSELYILDKKWEFEENEDMELESDQKEALVAAERIKQLIDSKFLVSEGSTMRPVRYSDIAVLSPSLKNKAAMISRIFALMDIPFVCAESKDFFDNTEIRQVVALLKAVDNPLNDIELVSVMRSGMFSFTENELVEIRLNGRDKPFYENVLCESEKHTPLGEKCLSFVKTLEAWRELSGVMSIEKFIARIVDESGYYSFVGALPGGSERQENIKSFLAVAAAYEKTQYKGLYNFVRYIDKTAQSGGNVDSGTIDAGDCVLVTTIHRSKGLEFPVCIVIGCGSCYNDRDAWGQMIIEPVGGIGLIERIPQKRVKFKTAEYMAISMFIIRANRAERMRLLYVAMTRAKEKLILIGSTSTYEKQVAQWDLYKMGRKMSDYRIRSINNYLDYLGASVRKKYWDVIKVSELPEIIKEEAASVTGEEAFEPMEEVIYRLSYTYPFDGVKNVPSKMSVSEIKKLSMEEEGSFNFIKVNDECRVPAFMKDEKKLTGAMRGTAFHRVMELIDLDATNVEEALSEFIQKGFMTKEQAECIDVAKIEAFLKSEIAKRMRRAKWIKTECPFTMLIDAKDVFEKVENEDICVQGTIDCLFEDENGKLVLLDYKTDYYQDPKEIGERYKKQLELYNIAVFKKFLRPCDEKCLYLFHNDDIIYV